ncbi:unnamed protein product [Parascedosporium putredinis]|uniref:Nucleotidyltransferase family protein n=1 Tax=Parascedosporium putredinis TaxID=1442378 RepID=A0A9P1H4R5_9PEZI|nr:unnamed protein product [Parascedosporium putredinis]CAI7997033.1 unnamed protein product [Parascedosporium putredinis]
MKPAQLPVRLQLDHLRLVLSTNPTLVEVLKRAATLNLPQWYVAAGAVSQTIWNHVSSLPPETGIHDYDLVFYDASDLSYEAEDAARVHLWYEERFGIACPVHQSVEDGIDSWMTTSAMIGVRLERDGEWTVYAPRGLSDFLT